MANPQPFALNDFGVRVNNIDTASIGPNAVQTYHGGTIAVDNQIVGRITEWHPSGAYNREGNHVYELGIQSWGVPVDYVPGRATGFNITWTRNEVWSQELELVLGFGAVWANLTDQNRPFTATELLFRGSVPYRTWSYLGCWFTEKNVASWTADGSGQISVSCNMAYVSRKRTLG